MLLRLLTEDSYIEVTIDLGTVYSRKVKVFINPNLREITNLITRHFDVRGLLDKSSRNLYVWPSDWAVHHQIEGRLKIGQNVLRFEWCKSNNGLDNLRTDWEYISKLADVV